MQSHWYAYLVRCADGSVHVGTAVDPAEAVMRLNAGDCGQWLKARLPVSLGYTEEFMSAEAAASGAAKLKRLRRPHKEELLRRYAV